MKNILKKSFALAAALVLTTAASQAATFHVDINTSALTSLPASLNAPFSLDFQFIDGGVLGNNTVSISNFTYGGGVPFGAPVTSGGAGGTIGSTVTFDNSAFFQELYQTFTAGTAIGFDVALTENFDGVTPDSFVVGILDSALANIPTTGLGDSLVQLDITGPGSFLTTTYSAGTGAYVGVVAVPEPATASVGFCLALAGALARRRRK